MLTCFATSAARSSGCSFPRSSKLRPSTSSGQDVPVASASVQTAQASAARYAVLALTVFLCGNAYAAGNDDLLRACLDMQGHVPSEQALECYNRAAQELLAKKEDGKADASSGPVRSRTLAEQWAPSDDALNPYKPIYFLLYSHSSSQNNTPTSPKPSNQVPYSYALDDKEMKFQISIKSHLIGHNRHALWVGYSQLSFWQVYDTAHSNPFRESDYEPEVIYSYLPRNIEVGGFKASFLNAGFVHQSNGQSLPRSRSWNRLYLQLGVEREFDGGQRLALLLRRWKHLWQGAPDDDNPDITHYLGHGDLEARFEAELGTLSLIARSRAIQLDLAVSLRRIEIDNADLHLQYFNGYGESLIDYNRGHSTFGIGLSMPFR